MDNKVTTFDKCPVCGSTERLAGNALKYMKEKGWAGPDADFYIQRIVGSPIDQKLMSKIPIGSKLPTIWAGLDVCLNCGCVYATRIMESWGVASIRPVDMPSVPELGQFRRN